MKPITSGQQEQCVNVIKDAARKGGEEAVAELSAGGVINQNNFQRVLGWKGLAPAVKAFVKEQIATFAKNITGCVRLISGATELILDPTDGKRTFIKAKDMFTAGFDPDFKGYGTDVPGPATGKTKVTVHEMIKDGTYKDIFTGMSDNLDSLCLTEDQIIQFIEKYPDWLCKDWYTLFLFKVNSNFFVAFVNLNSDGSLDANLNRFGSGGVWPAEGRGCVVVPQLAL